MDNASVNFKEIGSNITDLSINNDLSSYLELIKNSSFNTKEMITENSDEFISSSAVLLNEIDRISQSININNKSKDFATLEVLDPFIYLTEDGFSSPVGIFNPLTRIAELTEDLSDKTLIITIGNIVFDGNNHIINNRTFFLGAVFINEGLNNILIENINIINANFGITVKEKTLDITIKCCNISITNSGILAKFTRNLQLYNNQIISNNFGILYLESCSYSCITNNTFVNNNKAIYLAKENSFNTISNNSITNKVFFSNEVGICLGTYNSYNLINHNTVVFSDRTFRFKDSSITVVSNAILFNTGTNNINAIRDNTFEYKNNSFTFIADTIDIKIVQVKSFEDNNELEFTNNTLTLENNNYSLDIKGSIEIREANLFTVSNVSNEISKNNFKVANNNISFINYTNEIRCYFINLRFDNEDKEALVCGNEFNNFNNNIAPVEGSFKNYDILALNISVNTGNKSLTIQDNIFYLDNTVNSNYSNCIFINENNQCITIKKNEFKSNQFSPILLLTENHSCVIKHNLLSYPMSTGIVLGYLNTLNIIECNTINNIKNFAVALVRDNSNNRISTNNITNSGIAIYFDFSSNVYNTVSDNIFCNNTTNISIPSDSFNYVFNNIVKC